VVRVAGTTLIVAAVLCAATGHATTLLAPVGGARDAALAGSGIADPTDLMSAFFENPAGLTLIDDTQVTGGAGFVLVNDEIETPAGYDGDSDVVAMAPSAGAATRRGRFHLGVALFGTVGAKFDFPADPAHGVPRNFYTELGAITFAPTVAFELMPGLAVGAQLNPLFGALKNRVPTPQQHLQWKVQGWGVQGVIGLLYTPNEQWRFSATWKTPGEIFMRGTVGLGGKREDLHFDFYVPQQVIFGVSWRPTANLTLMGFGLWSDTSAFERSRFEFQDTPQANFTFAPESRDVWRGGGGVEYRVHPQMLLRTGFARAEAALEPRSVTPLVYDVNSTIVGAGVGLELGKWIIDVSGGTSFFDDRMINAHEARALPGRYKSGGPVTYAQVTRRF